MSEVIQSKLKQTYNNMNKKYNNSDSCCEEVICVNHDQHGNINNSNAYTNSYDAKLIERYISQIEEMKKENELLEKTNNELQEQIELTSSKILKETIIMQDITNILGLSSMNQCKINKSLRTLIDNVSVMNNEEQVIKDEFVMKLKQLYVELVGSDESNNNISYSKLEMLVHKVIGIVNDLMKHRNTNEISVNSYHHNNNSMRVLYKNFCRNIMKKNNINNIKDFETFILSIVNQREVNIS
jgi:hypothetical protein